MKNLFGEERRSRRIARAIVRGPALRLTLVLQLAFGLMIACAGVASSFAADQTLTADLKSYTSSPASSYLQMTLLNCGANIPRVVGNGVKAVAAQTYRANSLGVVSSTVTPNDDITCGLTTGATYYQFDVRVVQGSGLPDKTISSGTYCIHQAPFVLETAVPCFAPPSPIFPAQIYYPTGAKNGSNLNFTLIPAPSVSSSPEVYLNGVALDPLTDYTLIGSALTMTSLAPLAGDSFIAYYSTGAPPYQSATVHVPAGAKNGVNLVFTLDGPPQNTLAILILLNGQLLDPATDYTINGATLTLLIAPPIAGDSLVGYY